jgi:predicted ferric reductase
VNDLEVRRRSLRASGGPPPPPARYTPLRRPAVSRVRSTDVAAVVGAFLLLVTGVWVRHGGAGALVAGGEPSWTAVAQLSGLWTSAAGLLGLVLVARPRSLERRYGLDRLFIWHRYLGETMAVLLGVHVASSLVAWSSTGVWSAASDLTGREPYMAGATVGAVLVGTVTVTSLRSVRRHLAYETWYFVHLTAYLGLALSFVHTVTLGSDFATDGLTRWAWIALHVGVLVWLVWGRWGRLALAFTRPLRIASLQPVSPDTAAVELTGSSLARITGDAGQFFFLRPLRPGLWWQTHPFSLSAAPTRGGLRFTVKSRGDASDAISSLPVGTKVVVEGPYGACTPDIVAGDKILFIAGGVGVAPVCSLLQRLDASSSPIVLYRARSADELVHIDELRRLAEARGGRVLTLLGRTANMAIRDPFAAEVLVRVVPDLAERVAVLCGPEAMLHAARRGLLAAGTPSSRIHFERPWW